MYDKMTSVPVGVVRSLHCTVVQSTVQRRPVRFYIKGIIPQQCLDLSFIHVALSLFLLAICMHIQRVGPVSFQTRRATTRNVTRNFTQLFSGKGTG